MLKRTHRFYAPPYNIQQPHTINTIYPPIKTHSTVHFDANRNTLPDRSYHHNSARYYQENNMNKSPYVMRNNIANGIPYSPYPTTSPTHNYYTSPEKNNYTDRNMINAPYWPFAPVTDYCAELLNRDKHYWTEDETGLMLELYEENRDYFTDSRTKKTKLWGIIANMINKKFNTNVNSEQCSQKYRNMKAEYLKQSETLSPDGEKKFGKHFIQMRRLIEAEERFYLMQENNWLVKDDDNRDFQNKMENGSSPSKLSPSNNNNVKCEQDNIQVDTDLNLPSMNLENINHTNKMETTEKARAAPKEYTCNRDQGEEETGFVNLEIVDEGDSFPTESVDNVSNQSENVSNDIDEMIEAENNAIDTLIGLKQRNEQEENMIASDKSRDSQNLEPNVNDNPKIASKLALPLKSQRSEVTEPINSFRNEVSSIFADYITKRQEMLESYELNEKENIQCMGKCVEIFYRVLKEKINK